MSSKSTVSEGYLTMVREEIRVGSGVRVGDVLEWSIEGGLIVVRPRHPSTIEGILGRITHGLGKMRGLLSRAIGKAH